VGLPPEDFMLLEHRVSDVLFVVRACMYVRIANILDVYNKHNRNSLIY